ncbi:hypothetical protein D3C79_857900 [compost metagenome]
MNIIPHRENTLKEHIRPRAAAQIDIQQLIPLITGDNLHLHVRIVFIILCREFLSRVLQEAVIVCTFFRGIEYSLPLGCQPYGDFHLFLA